MRAHVTLKACLHLTYSLHCSSLLGPPFGILNTYNNGGTRPKKGTIMETVGKPAPCSRVMFMSSRFAVGSPARSFFDTGALGLGFRA